MFVAPMPLLPAAAPRTRTPRKAMRIRFPVERALLAWFGCGSFLLLAFPGSWPSPGLGFSLPFWLFAAPLLDLAWLRRGRLVAWLGRGRPRRRARVQASRWQ